MIDEDPDDRNECDWLQHKIWVKSTLCNLGEDVDRAFERIRENERSIHGLQTTNEVLVQHVSHIEKIVEIQSNKISQGVRILLIFAVVTVMIQVYHVIGDYIDLVPIIQTILRIAT